MTSRESEVEGLDDLELSPGSRARGRGVARGARWCARLRVGIKSEFGLNRFLFVDGVELAPPWDPKAQCSSALGRPCEPPVRQIHHSTETAPVPFGRGGHSGRVGVRWIHP